MESSGESKSVTETHVGAGRINVYGPCSIIVGPESDDTLGCIRLAAFHTTVTQPIFTQSLNSI